MDVTSDDAGLTYKRARTADGRRRIGHEAAVLRRVAHPGVVQLINTDGADPPETLVLRTVTGGDLTALGPAPAPVIAGLGAAVATTVADLHAVGFCHGGIEASHVLLDEAGRPVLCSLSRSKATATAQDADRERSDDVRALAIMLLQLLPSDGSFRMARMLRGLATASRRRPRRDASWLACHLMSMVPDARLPGPGHSGAAPSASAGDDRRAGPSGSLPRIKAVAPGRLVGVGAGLCVLVAVAAVLTDRGVASDGSPDQTSVQAAPTCPVVDDGCVPVPMHGGVVVGPAGRFAVGQPGDVVVMGRWGCGPTALPAVLRPGTGDVWTFGAWATPDDPVVGQLVGRVTSARSLRVVPGPSGCDRLEVDRRNLPPVTIPLMAR